MLLHRVDQLLKRVPHELQVLQPCQLALLDPCIDREQPRLIDLLRLDQRIHPVLLPLLQRLHHLSLVQEVLLVLAEVLGTHILDLSKLLIVNLLEGVAVGLCLRRHFGHLDRLFINALHELLLEGVRRLVHRVHHISLVRFDHRLGQSYLVGLEFVISVDLLLQLFTCHRHLIRQVVLCSLQLAANLVDQVLIRVQHVLVLIKHLTVLDNGLSIAREAHLMLLHHLLIVALQTGKLFLPLVDALRDLSVHLLGLVSDLLVDFVET